MGARTWREMAEFRSPAGRCPCLVQIVVTPWNTCFCREVCQPFFRRVAARGDRAEVRSRTGRCPCLVQIVVSLPGRDGSAVPREFAVSRLLRVAPWLLRLPVSSRDDGAVLPIAGFLIIAAQYQVRLQASSSV